MRGARLGTTPILCDVSALTDVDLGTVDALARLALAARRRGRHIELLRARPVLRSLLDLVGLADVMPCAPGSGGETRR